MDIFRLQCRKDREKPRLNCTDWISSQGDQHTRTFLSEKLKQNKILFSYKRVVFLFPRSALCCNREIMIWKHFIVFKMKNNSVKIDITLVTHKLNKYTNEINQEKID